MFVAMGLSAVVPVLHGLSIYGWEQLNRQMSLLWVILQGFLYVLGAGLYAVRKPCHSFGEIDVLTLNHSGSSPRETQTRRL